MELNDSKSLFKSVNLPIKMSQTLNSISLRKIHWVDIRCRCTPPRGIGLKISDTVTVFSSSDNNACDKLLLTGLKTDCITAHGAKGKMLRVCMDGKGYSSVPTQA